MGKGNKTTTTSNQSQTQQGQSATTIDGRVQNQVYKNIDDANSAAAGWNPTVLQGPAGFTADQLAAFDATRAAGQAGTGATQQGLEAAQRAAGYAPQQVGASSYNAVGHDAQGYQAQNYQGPAGYGAQGYKAVGAESQGYDAALASGAQGYDAQQAQAANLNRGQIRDISSGSTLDKLPQYQDKFSGFSQGVIDSTLNDLNRARTMTMQGNDAAAARAGAFGSRRDLLDAETNRGFADAAARSSADIRQQGFQQALGALNSDQQRQFAADSANQGVDLSAYGTNAGFQQGANLSNASAQNQARQFGADANNSFTLSNQNAQNQSRAFGANAANNTSIANAAATNQAGQFNANSANNASQFNADLGARIGQGNQNAQNSAAQFNSGQFNTVGMANANSINNANQFNAGQSQTAATSNQAAGLTANGQALNAGIGMANIGAQQQNMAHNNAAGLTDIGNAQQNYNQSVIDNQNTNAQNAGNADVDRLKIQQSGMNNAVYGTTTNSNQSGTSSGTQTSETKQSLGSSIGSMIGTGLQIGGAIASGGASAGSLFGNAKKLIGGGGTGAAQLPSSWTALPGITSDKRLKKNVVQISDPMMKIHKMKGVDYQWKGDGRRDSGLLAQQVAEAAPSAAMNMGGGVKGYNPAPVLGLLVEAVKHLDKRVSKGGR